jgi:aconitate hydratase
VLPLQFLPGEGRASLGLSGRETFDVLDLDDGLQVGETLRVRAPREDGSTLEFRVRARVDSPIEVDYLRHGGILQMVLRTMMRDTAAGSAAPA